MKNPFSGLPNPDPAQEGLVHRVPKRRIKPIVVKQPLPTVKVNKHPRIKKRKRWEKIDRQKNDKLETFFINYPITSKKQSLGLESIFAYCEQGFSLQESYAIQACCLTCSQQKKLKKLLDDDPFLSGEITVNYVTNEI